MPEPIDTLTRNIAVTEQDRNIVVTAGAGTGKTTLLVNRMLHLLLGHKRFQKEESPILRIVAMTFTDKAASEMKIRLAGELEKIVAVIKGNASQEDKETVEGFLAYIRDTYHTTSSEIEHRARKSLEDMDKALIGTIHSFAAYILRLYPIESGVVPGFVVDEGDAFDELFDKEWAHWIESELVLTSPNANIWKIVLRRLDLESLKEFAKRLSGFTIPLDSLTLADNNKSNVQSLTDLLLSKILKIISHCEKPNNNLLLQLNKLSKVFDAIKKQGIGYLNNSEYDLDKNPSEAKTGWTDDSFGNAQELVKDSHALLKKLKTVDETLVKNTINLILHFAKGFKQTYLSQGYVSFDGLLTLTRNLLQNKEYRYVRNKLKNEFRAILVDEFQDTDPIQYEIVLFLSESLEHYSKDARKVTL
ncbi:MAG: UvrD-helicase domain-containing protein, partial [Planctomycetota bacterium]